MINPFKFNYIEKPSWPPLAWLARWSAKDKVIEVLHGSRVETADDWFGEVVWDGEYAKLGFDQTDIVFGSAVRLIDDGLVFVSASHTIDRLVSAKFGDQLFVSNSIVCLAAVSEAEFAPWCATYPADFKSVINGPNDYVRDFQTSRGAIRLTYYKNLKLDGQQLVEIEKPLIKRNRKTFAEYRDFLESAMRRCCDNLNDTGRHHPWELMGTLSTGFDSTTAAALGRKLGLQEAITITSARGGDSDCGTPIGKALGLQVHEVKRNAWESYPIDESLFLAADAKGEDVYFRGAGDLLKNRVLLTGFAGSIWGGASEQYIQGQRTDQSGLSLTEYRLHAGAINIPVPSIGVYGSRDLLDLMGSGEAAKWAYGKPYDKPFCRMILTEAGVPSELYGNVKKAASVLIEDRSSFLSDASRADFECYLERLFSQSQRKKLGFYSKQLAETLSRRLVGTGLSISSGVGSLTGSKFFKRVSESIRLSEYASGEPKYRFLFTWAMEHAKRRYL